MTLRPAVRGAFGSRARPSLVPCFFRDRARMTAYSENYRKVSASGLATSSRTGATSKGPTRERLHKRATVGLSPQPPIRNTDDSSTIP